MFALDSAGLPTGVKQLSTRLKQKWVDEFNAAEGAGVSKEQSMARANNIIKGYFSWDAEYYRVPQKDAKYEPYGASGGKGCASCQFFMSPDTCLIVEGDISPTGTSMYYTPKVVYKPDPIEVVVVSAPKSKTLLERIKEFIGASPAYPPVLPGGGVAPQRNSSFKMFKDADGTYKWFAIYSNNFRDLEQELIPESAHKEYVEFCDANPDALPELHYYHAGPLSRWGKATFVDYVDGFAVASGTVDKDKNHIAEALLGQEQEVSHGFYGVKGQGGLYLVYRTFEISPLPVGTAANPWGTGFELSHKEFSVPFSEQKKAGLVKAGFDPAAIAAMEANMKQLSDIYKSGGVEFKNVGGIEDVPEPAAAAAVEPPVLPAIDLTEVNTSIAALTKTLSDVVGALGVINGKIDSTTKELDAVKAASTKSVEEKANDMLLARINGAVNGGGHQASTSDKSITTDPTLDPKKSAGGGDDWFANAIGLPAGAV